MARKRRIGGNRAGELNLVAMIDVAFQLLAFFLIVVVPHDAMAELSVRRPCPPMEPVAATPALRITVYPDGYTLNERLVSQKQVEERLEKLADIDNTQGVLIQCTNESTHDKLVTVLDLCAKLKMTNLSVVSSAD
ncbi:MAG: biopolymer transporter ExbD [bacterium]